MSKQQQRATSYSASHGQYSGLYKVEPHRIWLWRNNELGDLVYVADVALSRGELMFRNEQFFRASASQKTMRTVARAIVAKIRDAQEE